MVRALGYAPMGMRVKLRAIFFTIRLDGVAA